MQSRRTRLPEIFGTSSVADLSGGDGIALAEPDGSPHDASVSTILIGPEGGWTDEELAAVPMRVGLGGTILRVETAALVAAVRLTAMRDHPLTL